MGIKSIALGASTLIFSTGVHAALVFNGWQTPGDNLITKDTVTGLEWLDLTETTNMSHGAVKDQLTTGGIFEGFRVATRSEIVNLWANWSIDLDISIVNRDVLGIELNLRQATEALGDTYGPLNFPTDIPWGVVGYHSATGLTAVSGAFYNRDRGVTTVLPISNRPATTAAKDYAGTYLVRGSVVPVPPAVWLFGTGLLGLIGVARRKACM